jgi:hypothetical protein
MMWRWLFTFALSMNGIDKNEQKKKYYIKKKNKLTGR